MLILTDSIQLGDRPRQDAGLVMFEEFNEPFYRTYIAEDFGAPCISNTFVMHPMVSSNSSVMHSMVRRT